MFMFAIFLTIQNANADKETLVKAYEWEKKPAIQICGDSNVTIKEVNNALSYWQDELNNKNLVKSVSYKETCSFNRSNVILFTNEYNRRFEKELANTNLDWYYYEGESQKYLNTAKVAIPNNISYKRQLTITHELGHALGYHHSNHEVMKSHF